MVPYMSYWCGGYRKQPSEMILLMHKIACYFAKQHYGECHLITDNKGSDYFKNCNYSSIITLKEFDDFPKEYDGQPWSYGKIVAYKYLASKKIHFLHLDYDVFLFKRLPEFIEKAKVFAQSEEPNAIYYYEVDKFLKLCNNPYLIKKAKPTNAANCGIFGGSDFDFIYKYASSSIEMILDKDNKKAWTDFNIYYKNYLDYLIFQLFFVLHQY